MCVCRSLLRRVRRHDPAGRQRLYLRLRHLGRVAGLDHRVGSHAGIRDGRQYGLFGLVEPLHRTAEYLPHQNAAVAGLRSLDGAEDGREYCCATDRAGFRFLAGGGITGLPRQGYRDRCCTIARIVAAGACVAGSAPPVRDGNRFQPSRLHYCADHYGSSGCRDQRECAVQRDDRHDQGSGGSVRNRARSTLHQHCQLGFGLALVRAARFRRNYCSARMRCWERPTCSGWKSGSTFPPSLLR